VAIGIILVEIWVSKDTGGHFQSCKNDISVTYRVDAFSVCSMNGSYTCHIMTSTHSFLHIFVSRMFGNRYNFGRDMGFERHRGSVSKVARKAMC